jgi:hypothetical protein
LGIFRYHDDQKTNVIDKYIEEAEMILKGVPQSVWLPNFLLKAILYPLRRLNPDINWFGTKCDKVRFNPRLNRWLYIKSFLQ